MMQVIVGLKDADLLARMRNFEERRRPRHPHPERSQDGVREVALAEEFFLVAARPTVQNSQPFTAGPAQQEVGADRGEWRGLRQTGDGAQKSVSERKDDGTAGLGEPPGLFDLTVSFGASRLL